MLNGSVETKEVSLGLKTTTGLQTTGLYHWILPLLKKNLLLSLTERLLFNVSTLYS